MAAMRELSAPGWMGEGRRRERSFSLLRQLTMRHLRHRALVGQRSRVSPFQCSLRQQGWVTPSAMLAGALRAEFHEEWDLWGALRDSFKCRPLPDYLRIEDRNSMAYGIEARVPFLDNRLVEFAFELPTRMKLGGGVTKFVHRAAMRGLVPDALLDRPDKFGFPVDEFELYDATALRRCIEIIASGQLPSLGLIDVDALSNWIAGASPAQGISAMFTALQATLLADHATALAQRARSLERLILEPVVPATCDQPAL